ncbi:MAG: hypothetical protein HY507_01475 [Candidatus Zambryskibacteria bacterium]|nr:hypothetical protein [Candidatus Zambryskibacteria bacterium]
MPPDKKPETKISLFRHPDPFVEIVFIIFFILVALYLINAFILLISSSVLSPYALWSEIKDFITGDSLLIWIIRAFMIFLSVVLAGWISYLIRKVIVLRRNENKLLYPEISAVTESINPQWEQILNHIESTNENDWRQSIMEADIMLGQILDEMNLPGETMGDKLKAVDRNDFITIDRAWEAHKVRNLIAHEGSGFILTQRQARETITLYQKVFEEFKII